MDDGGLSTRRAGHTTGQTATGKSKAKAFVDRTGVLPTARTWRPASGGVFLDPKQDIASVATLLGLH